MFLDVDFRFGEQPLNNLVFYSGNVKNSSLSGFRENLITRQKKPKQTNKTLSKATSTKLTSQSIKYFP